MKYFEIIIAAAMFAFYFIDMARIPAKWKINFKPFNCIICLSSWTAFILYWLPIQITEIMMCMFGAGILSAIIKTIITKTYETRTH